MVETALVLGTTAQHLGVPVADLLAWAMFFAFLAAPAPHDSVKARVLESGGARLRIFAPRRPSDKSVAVAPAPARVSVGEQWQAVSRLVADGAERAIAVARDHHGISRELDSLDLTLENLRRELAAVMTVALPPGQRSVGLVALPVRRAPYAMAA